MQNSGILFRISKVWNPAKTAAVILGNPEIFKYPIQCRPYGEGGGGAFSGTDHYSP